MEERILPAEGILAPLPGEGVDPALETFQGMLRRDRGYRDHAYLLLEGPKATAESRRVRMAA